MKKKLISLAILLLMVLAFSNTLLGAACWAAPEPFEIISGDGSKVFVFTPAVNEVDRAGAVVYEIVNNERQPIYMVEDLASFAYDNNFYFSDDMMHFARIFPEYGMSAFEVFSYGARTRVVLRSDFIDDYASIEAESSVGPFYKVTWSIEEHSTQNATITIITNEGTVYFDLATARFSSEKDSTIDLETTSGSTPVPVAQTRSPSVQGTDSPAGDTYTQNPQADNSPIPLFAIIGAPVTLLSAGAIIAVKRNKD